MCVCLSGCQSLSSTRTSQSSPTSTPATRASTCRAGPTEAVQSAPSPWSSGLKVSLTVLGPENTSTRCDPQGEHYHGNDRLNLPSSIPAAGTWSWQNVRTNVSADVFLAELREATWYELKMKACNSAGCGNQSSQFATLDYDGSESPVYHTSLMRFNLCRDINMRKLISASISSVQVPSRQSNPR